MVTSRGRGVYMYSSKFLLKFSWIRRGVVWFVLCTCMQTKRKYRLICGAIYCISRPLMQDLEQYLRWDWHCISLVLGCESSSSSFSSASSSSSSSISRGENLKPFIRKEFNDDMGVGFLVGEFSGCGIIWANLVESDHPLYVQVCMYQYVYLCVSIYLP